MQRLLKYSLLLGAIIETTPDAHNDRDALIQAKKMMEEVARSVNEERRRWEVVREVLGGAPLSNANGKSKKSSATATVGVGVTTVQLGRIRSRRPSKMKDLAEMELDSAEAVEVARLEAELQRYNTFFDKLAKDVRDWRIATHVSLVALRQWGITFGAVLGLTPSPSSLNPELTPDSPTARAIDTSDPEVRSEAYDAFTSLLSSLPPLCDMFEERLQEAFIPLLYDLKSMLDPPKKLLTAMYTLAPLHAALLQTSTTPSRARRPAQTLLTASQSYLALRSALAIELPLLLAALNRATALAVRLLAEEQANFYSLVRERWGELWDALRVEGERCGPAEETLRVWWERWTDVEDRLAQLKIIRRDKWWAERERELKDVRKETRRDTRERSAKRGIGPTGVAPPDSLPVAQGRSHQHVTTDDSGSGSSRRRSGSSALPQPMQIQCRPSDDSLRSGKSGKSGRSGKSSVYGGGKSGRNSRGDDEPPVPRLKPNFVSQGHKAPYQRPIDLLNTSTSSLSHVIADIDAMFPPSPLSQQTFRDRGRSPCRLSFKTKASESTKQMHHRRRSSSVKSLDALTPSSNYMAAEVPLPSYLSSSSSSSAQSGLGQQWPVAPVMSRQRASPTLAMTRALYATRVIHPCDPPPGVSFRGLPFFRLEFGDMYDVLREYGHPSTHHDLPLYVDDGEDCLLLVRTRARAERRRGDEDGNIGEVGWALASFLIPVD